MSSLGLEQAFLAITAEDDNGTAAGPYTATQPVPGYARTGR